MGKIIENKYTVNEEKGVVVCHRKMTSSYIDNEVEKRCSPAVAKIIGRLLFLETFKDSHLPFKLEIPEKFKGVARCDERDTFDEKVGRDVARLIAKKKHHSAAMKTYDRLCEFFMKAAKEMNELAMEHDDELLKVEETLNKYKA
jgi:hypothetical protein